MKEAKPQARTPKWARSIIARHACARAIETLTAEGWENYPEIGEHDWNTIVKVTQEMRRWPPLDDYDEAYKLLAARADKNVE